MLFLPQIKLQLPAFMFVNTIDLHNELRNEYLGLGKDSVRSSINYEAYSTGLKKKRVAGRRGGGFEVGTDLMIDLTRASLSSAFGTLLIMKVIALNNKLTPT